MLPKIDVQNKQNCSLQNKQFQYFKFQCKMQYEHDTRGVNVFNCTCLSIRTNYQPLFTNEKK